MAVWLWNFWIFSFWGWCLERLFAAVTHSPRQRRRCLLVSPLCPVYGLGMGAVLALPAPLLSGWRLYFFGSLAATAVEYLYHWWGDCFLRLRFWDYTSVPGNLRGRVCLPFSLAWGALSLPMVWWVHPRLAPLLAAIPAPVTWLAMATVCADLALSAVLLRRSGDRNCLRWYAAS